MTEFFKIICDDCKFCEECVDYGWQGCRKFTPKQTEPLTNEEYIRSCSTEDLAVMIYHERCKYSDGWYEQCGHTIKEVERWLKEKHE